MEQDSGIEEVAGEGGRRISRRTLIKGSAVVGATVWAAPVVESFTSKAFAASATHYCCACANPVSGQGRVDANQGEEDDSPPTESDCAQYCGGATPSQTTKYDNFIWCGPSSIAFGVGPLSGARYGCYHFNSSSDTNSPATGCTSGTIIYSSGVYKSYQTTSTSASGVFKS